ncbi:MAG: hypothetical protein JWO90_2821 [Solirubrobacterales bacterium]|nr:hypothetical protein [Solirubrobacterales bacterium]
MGPGLSRAQLHAAADAALQWAKRHGGDAARVHDAATMGAATAERGRDAPVRGAGVGDPLALQERLRNARAFWRSTLDALPSHVAVLDARGEVLAANTAWSAWAQAGTSCVRPAPGQDYLTALEATGAPADARLAAGLRAIVAGGSDRFELEYACETPAGPRWFVVRANRFPAERPLRVVVHHADVTEARSARDLLVQQGQLLHKVPAAVVATDLDGAVTQWSDGAEALYGFHRDEALGRRIAELLPAVEPERGTGVRAEDAAGGGWEGELHLRDKRGIVRPVHVESTALVGDDGTPVGSVSVSVDLTGRDAHERDIEAARDYLLAVTSSMADGLLTCDREGRITYANAAAAELLGTSPEALFGRALREAVYPGGTGAAGVPAIDVPEGTARADDDRFATADGTPLAVSWTSTELPDVGSGPGRLVTFADATARRVREARLRHEADALRWAARIRTALEEDQFVLFAQPIVASATGLTTGHELLIRLRDGRGGFVPPAEFLPAAEEHGLMTDIDAWVLEHAVEIAGRGEHVHVNLSAQSVGDPSVITRLRAALERTGADPARVTLELTETALFTNADAAVGFAAELRGLGCGLALDDFGTGWNSLTRIQRIPVDELKIDMRFVRELLTHATSESVVKAIVSLAADLDVTTVAEGVEDPATAAKLRALGVTHLQGHHFGRPAPIAAVPVPAARGVLPPGLSVRAQQEGDVTVLALRGELDVETARQVRRAVSTARGTASRVVLDLADLEFVDSTGLGLLLELPRSAAAEDWQVAYRRPSRAVESVLAVAGIAALLPWADGDAPPA